MSDSRHRLRQHQALRPLRPLWERLQLRQASPSDEKEKEGTDGISINGRR